MYKSHSIDWCESLLTRDAKVEHLKGHPFTENLGVIEGKPHLNSMIPFAENLGLMKPELIIKDIEEDIAALRAILKVCPIGEGRVKMVAKIKLKEGMLDYFGFFHLMKQSTGVRE